MGNVVEISKKKPISRADFATASELFSRAAEAEGRKEYDEAKKLYALAVEMDPLYAEAHINLGTLCYDRGEHLLAAEHYRKAVEIAPSYALAHFDLANALDDLGYPDEAIDHYKKAISLCPGYADAHYNLAIVYEKKGEFRLVLRHFREYIKFDRSGPAYEHAKKRIKLIQENDCLEIIWRNPLIKEQKGKSELPATKLAVVPRRRS